MIAYRSVQLGLLALAASSPYWGLPGWTLSVATIAAFTAIALLGLNLVFGMLGMLAFGQAAFVALPGYAAGMLANAGTPLPAALLAATAFTIALAALLAQIFVRLPGIYFAVGSLGLSFVAEGLGRAFPEWTGGASGLVFAQGRAIGAAAWYALAVAGLGAGVLAYRRLTGGAAGRSLRTVRHDELAAAVLGIDVAKVKARAFTQASAFAAVAGLGLAYYVGVLVPEASGVNRSLEYVGTVLLGGLGYALGPLLGTALVQWLFVAAGYGERFELLLYGLAFLGAVLYARQGLAGALERPWRALKGRLLPGPITLPARPGTDARAPEPGPAEAPVAAGRAPHGGRGLEVRGLCRRFGGLAALRDVSFSAARGEIFALVGPNGAGKSTLFNILSGVVAPDAGQVLLDGRTLNGIPVHRRAAWIGRAFQVARLVDELTPLENVMTRIDRCPGAFAQGLLAPRARVAAAHAHLAAFGLADLADRPVSQLSAGQHKLVDIARAAVGCPPLVLLDEPAVGLTGPELALLREQILLLKSAGSVVVVVEHNIEFVTGLADQGIVLDSGSVIATGTMAEIFADPTVRKAYLGVLE
jgi:branched-chain amino acid transport system permease protein